MRRPTTNSNGAGRAPPPLQSTEQLLRTAILPGHGEAARDAAIAEVTPTLLKHALRIARSFPSVDAHECAADAVQDFWLAVLLCKLHYDARWPLTPFVMQAVRYLTIRRAMREGRAARLCDLPEPLDGARSPLDVLDGREQAGLLLRAFANLCPRDRDVLTLRFASGLTAAEVAERYGVSSSLIHIWVFRVRARLGAAVQESDG